nr:gamma subclass chorismate mutase AroQ [Elizabethkingia sp. ASV34]
MIKAISLSIILILIISCRGANARLEIDPNIAETDTELLIQLINKRLFVAPLVAKSKWNTKKPIDDPIREKMILDSVEIKAKKLGVNENFARDFFQSQFDAGKKVQRQLHMKWAMQSQGLFDSVPNLSTEVRPVLDNLTPELLTELKKIQLKLCNRQFNNALNINARKIMDTNFDNQVIKTAIAPFFKHCKK